MFAANVFYCNFHNQNLALFKITFNLSAQNLVLVLKWIVSRARKQGNALRDWGSNGLIITRFVNARAPSREPLPKPFKQNQSKTPLFRLSA